MELIIYHRGIKEHVNLGNENSNKKEENYNKKNIPYIRGNIKTFWAFTSTSPEPKTSYKFIGNKGTLFVLEGKKGNLWGYNITLFNIFKEEEILLEPERKFKIIYSIPPLKGIIIVNCEMQDTPLVLNDIFIEKEINAKYNNEIVVEDNLKEKNIDSNQKQNIKVNDEINNKFIIVKENKNNYESVNNFNNDQINYIEKISNVIVSYLRFTIAFKNLKTEKIQEIKSGDNYYSFRLFKTQCYIIDKDSFNEFSSSVNLSKMLKILRPINEKNKIKLKEELKKYFEENPFKPIKRKVKILYMKEEMKEVVRNLGYYTFVNKEFLVDGLGLKMN